MRRTIMRSLLISSAALTPLLLGTAWANPVEVANNVPISDMVPAADAEDGYSLELDPLIQVGHIPLPDPKAYSATLQSMAGEHPTRTLDARRPDIDLRFDLSASDKVEEISVTLSLDPLPGSDPSLPLTVSFNGGAKTKIETNGQGFDTTVSLDPRRARATGNVLTLSYPAPCDRVVGGYRLDLDRSSLNLMARPGVHTPQLRHIEKRLSGPIFAPRHVALLASGPNTTKLQVLAAQAIALRTPSVPKFSTDLASSDLELLMMTRTELASHSEELDILLGIGPAVVLSETHPNRIILTGDTDEEVMQSVSAFASASLPDSRRSLTTPEEILTQSPLNVDRHIIDGTANLDGLSVSTGPLRNHQFDVTDPTMTQGQLVLRLKRDEQTPSGTRLKVTLNEVSLGDARVRGRRRTVSYPIPKGLLVGTDNQLTLTTQEVPQTPRCGVSEPFIAIASGSELQLETQGATPLSDLSRFTANGSLFARNSGADTVFILPEKETDFLAALPVIARLAEASGEGWTQAVFVRGDTDITDRHRLVIEPETDIEPKYRLSAPRALQAAWRGQDDLDTNSTPIRQFASLNAEETIRQATQSSNVSGASAYNGVAAIYPAQSGHLIGLISNVSGKSFAAAMAPLSANRHWNGLTGGVTRWNDQDVLMAQAALPMTRLPSLEPSASIPQSSQPSMANRVAAVGARLPDIELKQPDAGKLGDWIDQQWVGFSEQIRSHDVAIAMAEASSSGLQQHLASFEAQATELNVGLQQHLGIPAQGMRSARLGQAQVIPGLVLIILIFLAGLIGVAFASPMRTKLNR